MKQRLTALAIVTAFFIFSVAFGFIIGKALNKTSVVDTQCIDQLKSCTASLTSGENLTIDGGSALGVSASIPEAPAFMRYMSNTGLTLVYPQNGDNGPNFVPTETKENDTNVLRFIAQNGGAEMETVTLYTKPDGTSMSNFIDQLAASHPINDVENTSGGIPYKFVLSNTDKQLKVSRYIASGTGLPVNGNGDKMIYPYMVITFTDNPSVVAFVDFGKAPALDKFTELFLQTVNQSISMIKR